VQDGVGPDGVGPSDFDVEHLAAAVHPGLRVDAVRSDESAVGVAGELRSLKGVGGATESAAALGLFAFRIGHDEFGSVLRYQNKASRVQKGCE